eukprot:TRINITY_DN42001_c0_g1_i2.p1 TRINITY_DN42001_c0_g1~~TRINITY_DN42001_c0_g1_i2.p1  ORF type:complete len:156 (+),score=19.36 TRINITY_DN42001_c0_g1_i2:85-552(+)
MIEHLCVTSYLPCDSRYYSRRYPSLGLTAQPVVPVQPCKSVCDKYDRECGPTFRAYCLISGDCLRIDCTGAGCDWLASINGFNEPARDLELPCPTIIHSNWTDYVNETTEWGDNLCNAGGGEYAIADCVYPLIKKEIGRAVQQECRDRSRMPSSA